MALPAPPWLDAARRVTRLIVMSLQHMLLSTAALQASFERRYTETERRAPVTLACSALRRPRPARPMTVTRIPITAWRGSNNFRLNGSSPNNSLAREQQQNTDTHRPRQRVGGHDNFTLLGSTVDTHRPLGRGPPACGRARSSSRAQEPRRLWGRAAFAWRPSSCGRHLCGRPSRRCDSLAGR